MKNTFNIFKKAAVLFAVALGLNSCLEKIPGDYILEEDTMNNVADAEQILTGIYSAYMSGSLFSGYLTLCPDIQADLVHAVQGNSNTYGPIWQWDVRPTNKEIEAVYGSLYSVIGNCNFLLDNAEKLKTTLTSDSELDRLEVYCGEAYFARALAYNYCLLCARLYFITNSVNCFNITCNFTKSLKV